MDSILVSLLKPQDGKGLVYIQGLEPEASLMQELIASLVPQGHTTLQHLFLESLLALGTAQWGVGEGHQCRGCAEARGKE